MATDRDIELSAEEAEAIGRTLVDAAENVRAIDKFVPGAVTTVNLFVEGVEYSVFVQVKRGD